MTSNNLNILKQAIELQHGGRAIFVEAVPIDERHDGNPVWQGTVHVFDLEDHPHATRAYAWSSPIEGSTKRRYFAVLHLGGIQSAQDAVRAAIVTEHRTKTQSKFDDGTIARGLRDLPNRKDRE